MGLTEQLVGQDRAPRRGTLDALDRLLAAVVGNLLLAALLGVVAIAWVALAAGTWGLILVIPAAMWWSYQRGRRSARTSAPPSERAPGPPG